MSIRTEDIPLIKQLEDVLVGELDRQYLDGEIESDSTGSAHFDAVDGEITGKPDWFKVVRAVVEALWEEEGR
ncbi:hypothetical protein J4U02_gp089 [Mycobacterium phage Aziz]|uniref:Uncharacterized protein n=2 Tax=Reyvirus TaxID=1623301 RepID=A0A1L6BYN5_9CAUD|nr:hypothetical protein J4U02_gp089 [Mycobacterium phage Aziz]YP_010013998.1 hypothetical protein J4U04_gp092 [Mycobacterium phage MrMagoo]ARM70270.1 hypothetical protein SEA_GARDENSALSA_92 [Mycobacterium phage GardenSalsa]ASR75937.1 hypothetical protein SEA_GENEVAB15_91 [Mycobacterium phage GenevaB15]APQ42195.1 hypothetical protein PBI_MRMAGOO_92 [Mycobacterium phage MrMagoo]QNJ56749.1 hypothetical protein SEA_AZIZ_89 [Mycobacterium phage Aziz]